MKKKELLKRIEELTNVVREMHENNVDAFDVTKTLKDRLFTVEHKVEALEAIVKPIADLQKASENAKGLEEKKDLEVGKWYKGVVSFMFFFNGTYRQYTQYGFNVNGEWSNQLGCIQGSKYTEATPQDVEEALIKEAKKRYKKGDLVRLYEDEDIIFNEGYYFEYSKFNNTLGVVSKGNKFEYSRVFENGKWAEIVEEKFTELKEAHENGAVIQSRSGFGWITASSPQWYPDFEYRIKPEEPKQQYTPKIGDVVMAWVNSKEDMVIGVIANIELNKTINDFDYYISLRWYPNVEPITDEHIIKLFN